MKKRIRLKRFGGLMRLYLQKNPLEEVFGVKKLIVLLLCLVMCLLLSGCSLERLLAMETVEANPVSEACTALIFGGREENGPVWVVTDTEIISALRDDYQWTHAHMLCCLEGTVTDYIDFVCGDSLAPWELSKPKLYAEGDVLAYNAAFRRSLRAAREGAVPMYRTVVYVGSACGMDDIRAALPGCMAVCGSESHGMEVVHILTPEPLTEAELSILRKLEGVRVPG